jgi:hypothetical protein
MLHVMNTADVICFQPAEFNLAYKLPEDGTDVPKHVGAVKHHVVKCVCNLCIKFVLEMNIKQSARSEKSEHIFSPYLWRVLKCLVQSLAVNVRFLRYLKQTVEMVSFSSQAGITSYIHVARCTWKLCWRK